MTPFLGSGPGGVRKRKNVPKYYKNTYMAPQALSHRGPENGLKSGPPFWFRFLSFSGCSGPKKLPLGPIYIWRYMKSPDLVPGVRGPENVPGKGVCHRRRVTLEPVHFEVRIPHPFWGSFFWIFFLGKTYPERPVLSPGANHERVLTCKRVTDRVNFESSMVVEAAIPW